MALSDYRLCDVCGGKAFYDAALNYNFGEDVTRRIRNGGELMDLVSLDRVGDWAVLCNSCAETHECVIVPRPTAEAKEGL